MNYTLTLSQADINQKCAFRIFKAMLIVLFDCVSYLMFACTDKTCVKAQRMINRALRVVPRADSHASVLDMHTRARCMTFRDRAHFN